MVAGMVKAIIVGAALFVAGCDYSTACEGGVFPADEASRARCNNASVSSVVVNGRPFAVCSCKDAAAVDAGAAPVEQ